MKPNKPNLEDDWIFTPACICPPIGNSTFLFPMAFVMKFMTLLDDDDDDHHHHHTLAHFYSTRFSRLFFIKKIFKFLFVLAIFLFLSIKLLIALGFYPLLLLYIFFPLRPLFRLLTVLHVLPYILFFFFDFDSIHHRQLPRHLSFTCLAPNVVAILATLDTDFLFLFLLLF